MSNKDFGKQATDSANRPIPVGSKTVFADVTGTPIPSPVTVAIFSTSVITLRVPTNATEIIILSPIAARYSTTTAALTSNYVLVPADVQVRFPLGATETIYIAGDAGGGAVSFAFVTV